MILFRWLDMESSAVASVVFGIGKDKLYREVLLHAADKLADKKKQEADIHEALKMQQHQQKLAKEQVIFAVETTAAVGAALPEANFGLGIIYSGIYSII